MQTQTYYAYIEISSAISNRIFFREELLQLLQCSAILSYFVLQIKSNQTSKLIWHDELVEVKKFLSV